MYEILFEITTLQQNGVLTGKFVHQYPLVPLIAKEVWRDDQ